MKRSVLAWICLAGLQAQLAHSNPVNLEAPSNSLGSADLFGNLRIWREIDEVDFGRDISIPLRIEFSAANAGNSPYCGRGWWVPLLEANAYLKRENMMHARLLCGKSMWLRRDRRDPTKYRTLDHEWTGVINGDEIVISREDGWELRYKQGLIRRLRTDTGRVLVWSRSGNLVTEIRETGSGSAPFRLLTTSGGVPSGFEINGKRHSFELDKRPVVQHVNGQNLIGGLEPSLSAWTWPDGSKELYKFEVDQQPGIMPVLTLTDREGATERYVWNPQTNAVISDGDWSYEIGKITQEFGLPRITRKNAAGQEEFISVDNARGITEEKTIEGGHRITEIFKGTGPLYGKVRKVETVSEKGNRILQYAASYDDKGRLIRETNANGITTAYTFDDAGALTGKKVLPTRDKSVQKAFAEKEAQFLKSIAEAQISGDKDYRLQQLALFYIGEMREPDKALALVGQVSDQNILGTIKLMAVNHDDRLTYAQKIEGYKKLVQEFPDRKEQLEWLITASEEMIAAGVGP
jgi:YD repeat-containing protein